MSYSASRFFAMAAVVLAVLCCPQDTKAATFKQDYDRTFNAYKSATTKIDFEAAAWQFQALAERDDAGQLKVNALYWQGECWYDIKEYAKALNCFDRVLLFPNSSKEEGARYKVAVCYVRLGWNDAAEWELSRFMRDFPQSELVRKAREELQRVNNTQK